MQIRTKLTLQFIAIVSVMILLGFGFVYYSSANYRKKEVYHRFESRAKIAMEQYVAVGREHPRMMEVFESAQKDKVTLENVRIFDTENKVVYSSDTVKINYTEKLLSDIRKKGRVEYHDRDFEILGITYIQDDCDFVILVAGIDVYGLRKVANLRKTLLILFIAIITMAAIGGWIFAGRALRPLNYIIEDVNQINIDKLDDRLPRRRNNDEIGRLVDTFNHLLERLKNSVELQRLFVSGASHELKNPLSSITSQLQVTLLNPRTNQEYERLIQSVLSDIQYLNQTTIALMEYARLSYENYIQLSMVRIDDILWSCAENLKNTNPDYKVHIDFVNLPDDENLLVIAGNADFLKSAFINLIDNACKFSSNKTCHVSLSTSDDSVEIKIADSGVGIDEGELKLIFEPFYRSDNTAEKKGHGIGLALTRKIFQLHGSEITVNSVKDKGTTFVVRIARAHSSPRATLTER